MASGATSLNNDESEASASSSDAKKHSMLSTAMLTMQATSFVHAVQLERGCSCAWVASGGRLDDFGELVIIHRMQTDRTGKHSSSRAIQKLKALRFDVDTAVHADSSIPSTQSKISQSFYAAFHGYTSLISQLLSDEIGDHELSPQGEAPDMQAQCAFAKLKEALGIQRAFICGALALPDEAVRDLPPRAFADFVTCMHAQVRELRGMHWRHACLYSPSPFPLAFPSGFGTRPLTHTPPYARLPSPPPAQRGQKLAVQSMAPPKLLKILSAGFELPPQLQAIQETLMRDFDVPALKRSGLTVQAWWELSESPQAVAPGSRPRHSPQTVAPGSCPRQSPRQLSKAVAAAG